MKFIPVVQIHAFNLLEEHEKTVTIEFTHSGRRGHVHMAKPFPKGRKLGIADFIPNNNMELPACQGLLDGCPYAITTDGTNPDVEVIE